MKGNLTQINAFLSNKSLAIIGASRNEKKFGNQVLKHLSVMGFDLYPVHPQATEIHGIPCYKALNELPDEVRALCMITHKQDTDRLIKEAIENGFKQIWVQQFSETEETLKTAANTECTIITGRCLFMYTQPEGIHKFHQRLNRLFGAYAT